MQNATPQRVLVLGDDTRAFLTTVRSLGRQDIQVHAASRDARAPALRSRYLRAIHRLPLWQGDGTEWLAAMEALLRAERFDLVVPCDETALLPLAAQRARFQALTTLAIPNDHALAVLFDKLATRQTAAQAGVPVARGRSLRAGEEPQALVEEFGLPLVLKPRWSYRLESLHRRGRARVLSSLAELADALPHFPAEETLVEGFHPGRGVGVSILAAEGRVLQHFQHERVREYEGASFYRISAPLHAEMAAACDAIVRAVAYTGIAMFEFRLAEDGRWVLLEVNARPWGSMPLPVALGVDFPFRWIRQLQGAAPAPDTAYRTGVYGRNLLPDLYAIRIQARSFPGMGARVAFVARVLWQLTRVVTGREVHDVWVRDDPGPAWAEFGQAWRQLTALVGRSLPGGTARRTARARRDVLKGWSGKGSILVVCKGNICRSPFAAAVLRRALPDPGRVVSAGTLPLPGRPSPQDALDAAAARGIDLRMHRSLLLTDPDVARTALVLVFDDANVEDLERSFQVQAPVVRLGDLLGIDTIADPVDGGRAVFDRTYDTIQQAVDVFVRLVAPPRPHA